MTRTELERLVINKLQTDMIFCFECDEDEKTQTLADVFKLPDKILLKYLEE